LKFYISTRVGIERVSNARQSNFDCYYFQIATYKIRKTKLRTRLKGRVGRSLSQLPDRLHCRVVQQLDVESERAEVPAQLVDEQPVKGLGRVTTRGRLRWYVSITVLCPTDRLMTGHRDAGHQRVAVVGPLQTVHQMHQRQLRARHVVLGRAPLPHDLHSTIVTKTQC